jgi:PAS domain S-box-containing protein
MPQSERVQGATVPAGNPAVNARRDVPDAAAIASSLGMHTRVLESMAEGVSVTDENGYIIYTNPAEDRMFGYESGELTGQNVTIQNAYPPEENLRIVGEVIQQLRTTGAWRGEWLNRKKDGTHFHTYARITSVDIGGRQYWVCVQEDVTAQREAAQRLQQSEQRLRAFVEATSDLVWTTDVSGRFVERQPSWEVFTGQQWPDYHTNGARDVIHPDDLERVNAEWAAGVQTQRSFKLEYRLWHAPTRQYRYIVSHATPVTAPDGSVREWVGTVTDVHDRRVAEAERRSTEEQLRSLINASPIPIVLLTKDGAVTVWNSSAERVFGWSESEVLGKPLPFIPQEKIAEHRQMRQRDLAGEGFVNREIRRRRKDGSPVDLLVSTAPVRDASGQVQGIMSVYMDITERKRMESDLRESEHRFRSFLEQSPMSTQVVGVDGLLVACNHAWEQLWGVEMEMVRHFNMLTDAQMQANGISPWIARALAGEAVHLPELPFTPDRGARKGETIWVRGSAYPVLDEAGTVCQVVIVQEDVTERRRAEEAVRESDERFRVLTQAMPALVWTAEPDGRVDYSNNSWLMYTGQTFEETLGWGWLHAVHPGDHPRLTEVWSNCLNTGEPCEIGYRIRRASDDEWRWHLVRSLPWRDSSGRILKWLGTATDIHDQVEAAERLRKSEERFRSLFHQSPVPLWESDWSGACRAIELLRSAGVTDFAGYFREHTESAGECLARVRLIETNRAAMHLVEASDHQKLLLRDLNTLIAPESAPAVADLLAAFGHRKTHFRAELFILTFTGEKRHVICDFGIVPGHEHSFDRVILTFTDTTERKLAEEALRRSETYFRELADRAPSMLWLTDPEGTCIYLSQRWCEFTGTSVEAGRGRGWLQTVHSEDTERVLRDFESANAAREPFTFDCRFRRYDGEWRWAADSGEPRFGPDGEFLGYIGTIVDITDRKIAEQELRARNEELRHANAELEEFAFVASHDLQEPLRTVNIFSELLLRRYPVSDGGETRKYVSFIQAGVRRMEVLIQDLLAYSRSVHTLKALEHPGTADLDAALNDALAVLQERIVSTGAQVRREPLPAVRGEISQMAQVFQNLLSNSLKYCSPEAVPTVAISARPQGDRWIITVADNGIGFDSQYCERVFGLFKRLHRDEYPGTGLGLAICKRIIERYGGRIWAESELGNGSKFCFELPAA